VTNEVKNKFIFSLITLLPGDVILTGTPSGVGVFREPKEFLKVRIVIIINRLV